MIKPGKDFQFLKFQTMKPALSFPWIMTRDQCVKIILQIQPPFVKQSRQMWPSSTNKRVQTVHSPVSFMRHPALNNSNSTQHSKPQSLACGSSLISDRHCGRARPAGDRLFLCRHIASVAIPEENPSASCWSQIQNRQDSTQVSLEILWEFSSKSAEQDVLDTFCDRQLHFVIEQSRRRNMTPMQVFGRLKLAIDTQEKETTRVRIYSSSKTRFRTSVGSVLSFLTQFWRRFEYY